MCFPLLQSPGGGGAARKWVCAGGLLLVEMSTDGVIEINKKRERKKREKCII